MKDYTTAAWFYNYLSLGPIAAWSLHSEYQFIDSVNVFYSLRREFIECRSPLPPYLLSKRSKRLPNNFDFARYLSSCLSLTFVEVISFSSLTWCTLWVFSVLVYCLALIVNGDMLVMACIWLLLGYLDVAVVFALSLKCADIVEHLLNPSHFKRNSEEVPIDSRAGK